MNQEYKNILVGISGSEQAFAAFKKAVEVTHHNSGKVYVANVIDQQFYNFMDYVPIDQNLVDQRTKTTKEMIEGCKEYGRSIDYTNVEEIIACGSVRKSMVVKLSKKYEIDLVMVGQSGLNTVERFIAGNVAGYAIRHSPCDVSIVSDEEEQPNNQASGTCTTFLIN